jgi:hypothetical protein
VKRALQARQCYLLVDQLVRLLLTDIGSLLIILIDDFDRDATYLAAFFEKRIPLKEARISIAVTAGLSFGLTITLIVSRPLVTKRGSRCQSAARESSVLSPSAYNAPSLRMPAFSCAAQGDRFGAVRCPYYHVVAPDGVTNGRPPLDRRNAPRTNIAIDQTVKNFNKMDLTKGTFEALDHGADAAILPSIKRYVTEGPDFNIWIARGNSLVTSRLQGRGAFKEIMRCVLDRGPCR